MRTDLTETRRCAKCGSSYSPDEELAAASPGQYVDAPFLYSQGVQDHCLACWLGVGPLDVEAADDTADQ
jgi:hypothetical protein